MSESLSGPLLNEPAIPRRVLTARREAAEALGLAFESQVPGWSVAPAQDYGSAVPLEDDILRETARR